MNTTPGQTQSPKTSGLAITSLVLALLGCTSLIGAICGHIALSKIKKSNGAQKGEGIAIAGIVCGYIFTILFMIPVLAAFLIPAFSSAINAAKETESMSNVGQISKAIILYSDANANQLPTDMDDLIPYLGGPMLSPFANGAPPPHYEMVASGSLLTITNSTQTILVIEKFTSPRGNRAVGYADGHVAKIREDALQRIEP
jgi:prepilin-type processing-associated H-X9-DG protein